jgi:hypothetical protein
LRVVQRGLPRAEQWDGMGELYCAVWRVSGRDQIALILLSLVVAALAAVPLKFQQLAVNSLVDDGNVFRLAWLCGGFLGAVLLSAGAKFLLGLRLALVGERVVRLIRERLYTNFVAQAAGGSADGAHGTLVTMLAAEAEVVGAFAGSAIATPVVQLGTLLSVIGYIAASPGSAFLRWAWSCRRPRSCWLFRAGLINASRSASKLCAIRRAELPLPRRAARNPGGLPLHLREASADLPAQAVFEVRARHHQRLGQGGHSLSRRLARARRAERRRHGRG